MNYVSIRLRSDKFQVHWNRSVGNSVFTLKPFQRQVLDRVRQFCDNIASGLSAEHAFAQVGGEMPYRDAPCIQAPSLCCAVPTGGGKTNIAAAACGIIAHHALKKNPCVVVWLVPSSILVEQTLSILRQVDHPIHRLLQFGGDGFPGIGSLRIIDMAMALRLPPTTYQTTSVILVATMQQFRVADQQGRQAYAPNDVVVDDHARSLVDVLAKRQPIIIVDEAHHARTPLSFDSLARLNPGFIFELTATPQRGAWASNVFMRVDASTLKNEQLLRLPLVLTATHDPERCLQAACAQHAELLKIAAHAQSQPYVRPILLIQAQAKRAGQPFTSDAVKSWLIAAGHDPATIAIATGEQRELDHLNIFSPTCPITIIITVEALREGWDCPFAMVLCTLRRQFSSTAATQLVGRIIRQPYARLLADDALNTSYAFTVAATFDAAIASLRGCLIQGLGFSPEAAFTAVVAEKTRPPTIFSPPDPPFVVPQLTCADPADENNHLVFGDAHRAAFDWSLSSETALLSLGDYVVGDAQVQTLQLDIDSDGEWSASSPTGITDPLPLATMSALHAWFVRRLAADDIRPDELHAWIHAALNHLSTVRHYTIEQLDHDRWQLAHILRERIEQQRELAERNFFSALFQPANVRTSTPTQHFSFTTYVASSTTNHAFQRHAYPQVAPFDSAAELLAAQTIDKHPRVKRWVRNPAQSSGFALPRRPHNNKRWYYPDFVVELTDGPLVLIEVKGSHIIDTLDAADKRDAGMLWAQVTGHGFIVMVDDDLSAISDGLAP
jgi:Type III restriction enzyme, res subunit